nr:odorant receptor 17 [Papilio memnon]
MGNFIKKLKHNLTENSLQSLIWLIDLVPNIFGYSYLKSKVGGNFFMYFYFILILVLYISIDTYNVYECHECRYFTMQSTLFYPFRKGLRKVFELLNNINNMPMQFKNSIEKRQTIFKHLKYIVLICYTLHFINEVIIYTPKWLAETNNFSIVSCIGLEPLTKSPNNEICKVLLIAQLIGAVVVTVCYDSTFLFLFGYTAAMFGILKEEIMSLDVTNGDIEQQVTGTVRQRLKNIVIRHTLTLHTVENIQGIYNFSIGLSFIEDAITMCLFFIMPLKVSLNSIPLLTHNFLTFFLYCYQGQRITTAAERFEMSVYCCGWENFDIKEQKLILTMLRQSQKPVIINAASVIPICIYTFACTMQGIYKFGAAFKS